MRTSNLEQLSARLCRAMARGSLRDAWRLAVELTVRDEGCAKWWVLRAALAARTGREAEVTPAVRQALFLMRQGGHLGRANAMSMWLRRRAIDAHRALRRAS